MKKLLALAFALMLPAATAQSAQPMPLNVALLPYGTITVADGNYYIPNYQETGISIYIQSPKAIPVANLDQMMAAQAAWLKYTMALNQSPASPAAKPDTAPPSATPATPAPTQPKTAVPTPPQPTASKPATPAAPQPSPAAATATRPETPPMQGPPAPTVKLPSFPNAQAAFAKAGSATPATPAAPTQTASVADPAPQVSPTSTTLVPEWVRVNFRGRGKSTSYSISNSSSSQTLSLDPTSLRAFQNGAVIPATLALRDSAGGNGSKLLPNSMVLGTITVLTKSSAPITVTWEAKDASGRSYPIAYAWMPE